MNKKLLFCILYFAFTATCYAGKYAGLFSAEGIGGKAQGLGEAYVSIADGAEGLLWNPAGLAFGRQKQISLMTHKEALLDTQYNFAGYLHAMENRGFGFTYINYNGGRLQDISLATDGTATEVKTVTAESGGVLAAGYGMRFGENLGLGLNLKFIQNTLVEEYSSNTPSADFGLLFRKERVSLGLSGSNLFGSLKYAEGGEAYSLSPVLRAGLSYKFLDGKNNLVAAMDGVLQGSLKINTGVEFLLSGIVAFRLGFRPGDTGDAGFSAGMGLKLGGLQLDYGMLSQNIFGLQHKLNLAFNFGRVYAAPARGEAPVSLSAPVPEEVKPEPKKESLPQAAQEIKKLDMGTADKMNIAVLNFVPQDPISPGEAAFITEFFRSGMLNTGTVRLIDKQNMDMILSEQGFQQTGCTTQECVIQMGKILNVKKMLTGNFGKLINKYMITINLIDVETGEINYSDKAGCTDPDELENVVNQLTNRLAGYIAGAGQKK